MYSSPPPLHFFLTLLSPRYPTKLCLVENSQFESYDGLSWPPPFDARRASNKGRILDKNLIPYSFARDNDVSEKIPSDMETIVCGCEEGQSIHIVPAECTIDIIEELHGVSPSNKAEDAHAGSAHVVDTGSGYLVGPELFLSCVTTPDLYRMVIMETRRVLARAIEFLRRSHWGVWGGFVSLSVVLRS